MDGSERDMPACDGAQRGMPCRLCVEHETLYRYEPPVELAHHVAFLRPLADAHQCVEAFELRIDPVPSHRSEGVDAFGNHRLLFTATAPHDELRVLARSRVCVWPHAGGFEPAASPDWKDLRGRLRYEAGVRYEPASAFSFPSPFVPLLRSLRDYAAASFTHGRPVGIAAIDLMHRVHADFRYEKEATDVHTPLAEVFEERRGVCQDFAHLMIGALRALGLSARYVSGYLRTVPAEPAAGDGAASSRVATGAGDAVASGAVDAAGNGTAARVGDASVVPAADLRAPLIGADASHAWIALWCPDSPGLPGGWLELDPTNDCVPALSHVRLAFGRDYGDVTPLRGVIRGGASHTLEVRVRTVLEDVGTFGSQLAKVASTGESA